MGLYLNKSCHLSNKVILYLIYLLYLSPSDNLIFHISFFPSVFIYLLFILLLFSTENITIALNTNVLCISYYAKIIKFISCLEVFLTIVIIFTTYSQLEAPDSYINLMFLIKSLEIALYNDVVVVSTVEIVSNLNKL